MRLLGVVTARALAIDPELLMLADRVICTDGGVIAEQCEPSSLLEAPDTERTRQFLSKDPHHPTTSQGWG
jgi:ABC-type proline/glycine betaine transport system ATPase subunit